MITSSFFYEISIQLASLGIPTQKIVFAFYNGQKVVLQEIVKGSPSRLLVSIDDINVFFSNNNEFSILCEVFGARSYDFEIRHNSNILIDIGMNIGIASLYFSSRKDVSKVYSFEPFLETYRVARENMNINPHLSKKVTAYNFGLSTNNLEVEVDYDSKFKGDMSTVYDNTEILGKGDYKKEKVVLRRASEIIEQIIEKHPTQPLVCKIDCEGAEYEIVEDLYTNNILPKLNVIIMEWHRKGPSDLINMLLKSNYKVFKSYYSDSIGLIYAVNFK